MKRSKHSLSHYKLATFDMGELVPVGHYEVLPGDSVRHVTSSLLRVSPLVSPVMHPVTVRLHHWFVPFRLLWDGWEDFITGGNDGLGDSSGAFPTIESGAGFADGDLPDYFGIPPSVSGLDISALPFRAYNFIYDEFYRDQDLVAERGFSTASGVDSTTPLTLAKIAWEKDYFTTARPWTQRGPDVTLPLGTTAPVVTTDTNILFHSAANATDASIAHNTTGGSITSVAPGNSLSPLRFGATTGLETDLSGATAAAVNDIRRAFALQRYQEARAQYGARYTEYLRYMGVRSSDARLQRPEYLGGGKSTISFSEILQTGPDFTGGTGNVGEMRGHGISAMRSRRYLRFFEEHGIVMTLASVRPKTMYNDGVHRSWLRRTKEDFWQKELENIGQQEIFNQEVYADAVAKNDTFGYQDRYADYRHVPSGVSGEFRSSLMNDWHLARIFASEPTLNESFVTCEPSKRIHAVTTNDVLWCLFNHSIQARRLVGKKTIGRVL